MEDVFHSSFNAALLHAVAICFSDVSVSFRGYPGHTRIIQNILRVHAPDMVDRIEWRSIESAPPSLPSRWRHNRNLLRRVLSPGERVLFTSISRLQLLLLKRLMRPNDEVRAVLHGDLEQIESPNQGRFPWNRFSLKSILLGSHPVGLRYLLLGQSIYDHMPLDCRKILDKFGILELSYHFAPLSDPPTGRIVFGVFGNSGDGRLLEEIARQIHELNAEIELRLIGYVADREAVNRLAPFVKEVVDSPLSLEAFEARARAVTYALWLAPNGSYRLRASGAFFDALVYGKPLVYTANPYIDSYVSRTSEMGIRCERLSDVPDAVLRLARRHSNESYARAQNAIVALRNRHTPAAIAISLPLALGWK